MNEPGRRTQELARALWYVGRGRAELRSAPLAPSAPADALVRTAWSALSRGTERLVFEGRVSVFAAPAESLALVPPAVPARRAALAANMETALNAVWDSGAGPGDRILVVGAGVVGLLVGAIAARLPGAEVTMVDVDLSRADVARRLGCAFQKPLDAPGDADLVFHASATAAGLACALACAGLEASVVELSWYGDAEVRAPLGLSFHSRRLRLVSSQVGEVAPSRRPRWTHRRRLDKALALLADDRLDALITDEVAFEDLPRELPRLLAPDAPGLATVVRYDRD